jgi:hypothetical protein
MRHILDQFVTRQLSRTNRERVSYRLLTVPARGGRRDNPATPCGRGRPHFIYPKKPCTASDPPVYNVPTGSDWPTGSQGGF